MNFKQADEQFRQLKARFESGDLPETDFKAQLQDLMVQDEQGTWWMIGYETEQWYRHDGTSWVQADPPVLLPPRPEPPATSPAKPITDTLPPGSEKKSADRGKLIKVSLAVGSVVVLLICLIAAGKWILSLINSPSGLAQRPSATLPARTATRKPTSKPQPTATRKPTSKPRPTSTPTRLPTRQPASKIVFMDDFSDLNGGWRTHEGTGTVARYTDGQYLLQALKADWMTWETAGPRLSDASIEVDAKKYSGTDNNVFGVLCRYIDNDHFYSLHISSYGSYSIWMQKGDEWVVLKGWTESNAIHQGGKANHLRADCVGSKLTLYVNGTQVGSVTDSTLPTGDVGLIVGAYKDPDIGVIFDNFTVYKP